MKAEFLPSLYTPESLRFVFAEFSGFNATVGRTGTVDNTTFCFKGVGFAMEWDNCS